MMSREHEFFVSHPRYICCSSSDALERRSFGIFARRGRRADSDVVDDAAVNFFSLHSRVAARGTTVISTPTIVQQLTNDFDY